jgi:hypothetical protein
MSCCGNKRRSLDFFPAIHQTEMQEEQPGEMIKHNAKKNAETMFRFTGKTSLEVKSLFGSQKYIFTKANPLVSVLPEDSDLMRAYSDLIEVKSG